jgi:hypothetical protein
LVVDVRTEELVVRTLYRTEGEAGLNTKARRREAALEIRKGAA